MMNEYIDHEWDKAMPTLCEYIKIPNMSPMLEEDWKTNGYQEQAMDLIVNYVKEQEKEIHGMTYKVHQDDVPEAGSPLLFCEIEAREKVDSGKTILLYGHMDKQPPLTDKWSEGLGPYKPIIKDGKLFGRGGADDGYSIFASLIQIKALQKFGKEHPRIVIMIEGSEESGSCHLPYYVEKLKKEIGNVDLVICLDSGCANYDQLWLTNSLRGAFVGKLSVQVLENEVHSGDAGGIVPAPFRIIRMLLDRLENSQTGRTIADLYVEISEETKKAAQDTAKIIGDQIIDRFPYANGVNVRAFDKEDILTKYYLRRTWEPCISYIGFGGIPPLDKGGNVIYPKAEMLISVRLPPTLDPEKAIASVKQVLVSDPPFNAKVTFESDKWCKGWHSPTLTKDLEKIVDDVSFSVYGKPVRFMGEGGSIPFMGMLNEKFPQAQFIVTGLLGPDSNAHGPDESMDIEMAKNVTKCVAGIIEKYT